MNLPVLVDEDGLISRHVSFQGLSNGMPGLFCTNGNCCHQPASHSGLPKDAFRKVSYIPCDRFIHLDHIAIRV